MLVGGERDSLRVKVYIMYVIPVPGGINPPLDSDKMPIWRVVSSDDLMLTTTLSVPGHPATPATPANSRVTFVLAEDRFDTRKIWTGVWNNGVVPVRDRPGLVRISIDSTVAALLRRGSYVFSMQISDLYGKNRTTVLTGTLLVEYEPTSDIHDIPYKIPNEPAYT